jgi:starch-binding outer membrane protein, SusD/RagB family
LASTLVFNINIFQQLIIYRMKLIKSLLILSAVLLTVAGCSKILDQAPYASVAFDDVFVNAERATNAVNGVYDGAQTGIYVGGQRGYPYGAANVQQGDNRGEDVVNIAAFYQITYQATYNANSANNVWYWNSLYTLINRANVTIEGIKGSVTAGTISAAVGNQLEGELRYLRAMAHHDLVIFYCRPFLDGNGAATGVPFRDFAVTSVEASDRTRNTPRGRVDSVYAKIIRDLNFAESNLPALNTPAVIRASSVAAMAMKMRVYMHMGQWDSVRNIGNRLIPATINPLAPGSITTLIGNRSMTATPNGSFTGNSIGTENIFTIRNDALDNAGVNGALASQYGPANLGGRGLVAVSPVIWNNSGWRADDLRRTSLYTSAAPFGTNANGGLNIMGIKYSDYVSRGDNNPHIRLPEVILMLAEAEARLSPGSVSTRAVDLLNAVRNRSLPAAVIPTAAYTVAGFATDVALLQAIILERRIEFLMEGKRWADIHRLAQDPIIALRTGGIPAKVINGSQGMALYGIGVPVTTGQAAIAYTDFRFIWPIPADEVTQNPIITQNPGY